MSPLDFVPVYDPTVVEYFSGDPNDTWHVSTMYCLMLPSAVLLASLLKEKPAVVMLPPWEQAPGSPFEFNHLVPWLKFPDSTLRNAAVLAGYWGMPGVPVADALAMAELDVATPVEGQ